MPVIVRIVYWLKDLLGKIFRDKIEVIGHETLERSGCFEIEVGEQKTLVHSKKRGDGFVDTEEKEFTLAKSIGKIIGVEVTKSMITTARGMDGPADLLLIDLDKHLAGYRKGKLTFVKKSKDSNISSSGSTKNLSRNSTSSDDEEEISFQPSPSTSPKRPTFKKATYGQDSTSSRGESSGYNKKFTTTKKQPDVKKKVVPVIPPKTISIPVTKKLSSKSLSSVSSAITTSDEREKRSMSTSDDANAARNLKEIEEETQKTTKQEENKINGGKKETI